MRETAVQLKRNTHFTMRPDEHKKKHRAEYKKKHGICNKKTASKERNDTNKEGTNAETQTREAVVENEEEDQAQFSRRKVASNWERYEELESESSDEEDNVENIHRRGEDFSVLLEKSENPASQFRFQSEREWDQESDASTIEVTNSTLEVDFGALAVALNSIPLHRRLDISPDNVHPDLVKEFESNAELCKMDQSIPSDTRNTKTTATAEPTSIPSDKCLHATILNSTEDNQQNFETKTFENSMGNRKHVTINSSGKDVLRSVTQSSGTSDPSKLQNAEELQTSLKDVLRTANATTTTINITSGKMLEKPAEYEEDDELESLLSLGTPGMNKNSDSTAVVQNKKEILSQKALPSGVINSGNQPANSTDDDLEDWLDSVLG